MTSQEVASQILKKILELGISESQALELTRLINLYVKKRLEREHSNESRA